MIFPLSYVHILNVLYTYTIIQVLGIYKLIYYRYLLGIPIYKYIFEIIKYALCSDVYTTTVHITLNFKPHKCWHKKYVMSKIYFIPATVHIAYAVYTYIMARREVCLTTLLWEDSSHKTDVSDLVSFFTII